MAHITVQKAEDLLDKEMPVLNHGFVRLVDYMGSDARIVQSARVSYGDGTKTVRKDRGLIHYLMRHEHWSPFEQIVFTFHLKMPIFVARQLVRHRTARLNEISGRYSKMNAEFFIPDYDNIRYQSTSNMQGGSDETVPDDIKKELTATLEEGYKRTYADYEGMIEKDIAREIARVNLPLSLYTEMYWQIDLRNLLHFIKLRLDSHAQYEIQVYAEKMAEAVKAVAPFTWDAFQEYIVGSKRLHKSQVEKVFEVLEKADPELLKELKQAK